MSETSVVFTMSAAENPKPNRRTLFPREHKHSWKRKAATAAAGALVAVMAYGVVFGHNGLTAFAGKREEARSLEKQARELQIENQRLGGHVERLQNDPGAIEHQAREELHYTRAGEVIYTIPTVPAKQSTAPRQ